MKKHCLLILFVATSATILMAQSLGDVARQNRENKTRKAKIVLDDDTLPSRNKSPFPELSQDAFVNNTELVLREIDAYRLEHTPKEIEEAIRLWYEQHDQIMLTMIEDNQALWERHLSRVRGTNRVRDRVNDARQYEQARNSDQLADDEDFKRVQKQIQVLAALRLGLRNVQTGLKSRKIEYDWFRIRPEGRLPVQ